MKLVSLSVKVEVIAQQQGSISEFCEALFVECQLISIRCISADESDGVLFYLLAA